MRIVKTRVFELSSDLLVVSFLDFWKLRKFIRRPQFRRDSKSIFPQNYRSAKSAKCFKVPEILNFFSPCESCFPASCPINRETSQDRYGLSYLFFLLHLLPTKSPRSTDRRGVKGNYLFNSLNPRISLTHSASLQKTK